MDALIYILHDWLLAACGGHLFPCALLEATFLVWQIAAWWFGHGALWRRILPSPLPVPTRSPLPGEPGWQRHTADVNGVPHHAVYAGDGTIKHWEPMPAELVTVEAAPAPPTIVTGTRKAEAK